MEKQITDTKRARLKELFLAYELDKEDIFSLQLGGRKIPIVTRTGVEKIMAKDNITLKYEVINSEEEFAAIKCYAKKGDLVIETFGSAHKKNCKSTYYLEMAEKRSKARAVLQITEFYSIGVHSEVEADEFKQQPVTQQPAAKKAVDSMEQTMRDYNGG